MQVPPTAEDQIPDRPSRRFEPFQSMDSFAKCGLHDDHVRSFQFAVHPGTKGHTRAARIRNKSGEAVRTIHDLERTMHSRAIKRSGGLLRQNSNAASMRSNRIADGTRAPRPRPRRHPYGQDLNAAITCGRRLLWQANTFMSCCQSSRISGSNIARASRSPSPAGCHPHCIK